MLETNPNKPESGEALENRVTALSEAIRIWPNRPIELDDLYLKNGALGGTEPFGGLAPIVEAHGRLRRFVGEFQDQRDKGVKVFTPEVVERAEKSLKILRRAAEGGDLSEVEKSAANLIANDLLRRARELKAINMLDDETIKIFNSLFSPIRQLLDWKLIDGVKPVNAEDKFPLAWTMGKVKTLEQIMEDAVARRIAKDLETRRENERQRVQARIQKHK